MKHAISTVFNACLKVFKSLNDNLISGVNPFLCYILYKILRVWVLGLCGFRVALGVVFENSLT